MASFYAYGAGYSAWPTLCNVSRERTTLRVPLSSFLPHDKRLWTSYICINSIGFDNPRYMWNLVVYRGATSFPLCHRANLRTKVWVLHRMEFQRPLPGSIHWTNPNPLKLVVTVEVWARLLAYTLDEALGINYPLIDLPSRDSACQQFFPQCVSNFDYRVWRDFWTSRANRTMHSKDINHSSFDLEISVSR